jgi:hypothetical protein
MGQDLSVDSDDVQGFRRMVKYASICISSLYVYIVAVLACTYMRICTYIYICVCVCIRQSLTW